MDKTVSKKKSEESNDYCQKKSIHDFLRIKDKTELQNLLKDKSVNINEYDKNGMTPLIKACKSHRIEIINILLENGANPNTKSMKGLAPLHHAVFGLSPKIIRILLDYKADVNIVENRNGHTPLHYAALMGFVDSCKVLKEFGADVELKNKEGKTVLDYGKCHLNDLNDALCKEPDVKLSTKLFSKNRILEELLNA